MMNYLLKIEKLLLLVAVLSLSLFTSCQKDIEGLQPENIGLSKEAKEKLLILQEELAENAFVSQTATPSESRGACPSKISNGAIVNISPKYVLGAEKAALFLVAMDESRSIYMHVDRAAIQSDGSHNRYLLAASKLIKTNYFKEELTNSHGLTSLGGPEDKMRGYIYIWTGSEWCRRYVKYWE